MFILIFNQLIKMVVIMVLAVFCYRIKLLNQEGNRNLSNLLLMVVNPCLIVTTYQTDYEPRLVKGLLLAFAAAFAAHMIGIFIARIAIRQKGNKDYAIDRFGSVYSNCGFMGIPLIYSVLGSEGVFYLTAYLTVFNLLSWTHGLALLEGQFSFTRLKEGLTSPMVIGTVIGALLFFLQIRLPGVLLDSMEYIANMNTPLAMIIAGLSVAQADLKKIFSNLKIYYVSLIKLIAVPLTVLLFLVIFRVNYNVAYTILIAASCPTATTLTMMAIRFEKNYKYASELFAFTTVLSIFTIPFIAFIAGFFL